MKPVLILGLGNPLMADDGVGLRVAQLLANDPRVTRKADVLAGGTDLLRHMDDFESRRRVILIDAAETDGAPGEVQLVEHPDGAADSQSAHSLSAVASLELIRRVMPALQGTRFTWVLVGVRTADLHPGLSPEVETALPRIAGLVAREVVGLESA